jgi:hypothetical protein
MLKMTTGFWNINSNLYKSTDMKLKTWIIFLLTFLTITTYAQNSIFEKINNKTWFESNGFAGTTIVFYRTTNGFIKSIRQLNGSGVPVISSGIYDVEIIKDTVFLFNGLNLKTSEKLKDFCYKYDNKSEQLLSNGIPLKMIHEESILYAWTDKRKNVLTQIDVKLLTEILIKKNEIYKDEDLIKTLIDK